MANGTKPLFSKVYHKKQENAETVKKENAEISDYRAPGCLRCQTEKVRNQVYEMITDNSNPNETVLVIGVGNTLGVAQ